MSRRSVIAALGVALGVGLYVWGALGALWPERPPNTIRAMLLERHASDAAVAAYHRSIYGRIVGASVGTFSLLMFVAAERRRPTAEDDTRADLRTGSN